MNSQAVSAVVAPASAAGRASRAAHVARLTLTDFRCYRQLRLDLDAAPVVLTGPNGAGKTNLLEALSFLAPGRGLRRAKLVEIDRRSPGATSEATPPWAIAAVVETAQGRVHLGTGREPTDSERTTERRTVRIDGRPTRGQKDLAEHLAIVWLTPELDRLFLDGSSARRRFVDRVVYGFHPEHASEVSAYETVLRERARLLADGSTDTAWLDALEDGMARHGVAIAAARAAVIRRLDSAAAGRTAQASPFPAARLALAGEVDTALAGMPAVAVEDGAREKLRASRSHDATHGGAAWGPHRTDLQVRYAAKDCPARDCSTGEQKALLLSVTLAVARELAAERGEAPLLLLDEVVAHLDGARRAALFDEIVSLGAQAWLTGTDDELFQGLRGRAHFFRVLDATVMPR